MAFDYRLTTSNPDLGAAPLPSTAVGEYVNQQITPTTTPGINESARNMATAGQITPAMRQRTVGISENPMDAVSRNAQTTQATNKRLMEYAIQNRKVRQAREQAQQNTQNTGTGSYGNNTYTVPSGVTGNRAAALQDASRYLGTRYVLGGTSTRGIDCSGLVMMVYNKMGYNITRHSATWQRDNIPGVRTNNINSLRPGDLVAWKDGSHIAIYAGNGEIIEAANERVGTVRRRLWASPSAVVGIKLQFPGE